MPKVVVNTTPLIALANVGKLELLRDLYGEILVPDAVLSEIKSEPAKSVVKSSSWIKTVSVSYSGENGLFRAKLHAGEVEVMLLAKEQNADFVIMDDNPAKKTARFMGLKVTGTLGVILKAKKEGLIERVEPVMDAIISDGFYIDSGLRQMVLEEADEL